MHSADSCPSLGYNGAIWVVAHRLARLVWKILHDQVSYVEQGQDTDPRARRHRAAKLARALRKLGDSVTLAEIHPQPVAEASVIFDATNTGPASGRRG